MATARSLVDRGEKVLRDAAWHESEGRPEWAAALRRQAVSDFLDALELALLAQQPRCAFHGVVDCYRCADVAQDGRAWGAP